MAHTVTTLTRPDTGKTVELRVGDTFALHLNENASTGYRWSFDDLDREVISVNEERYLRRSEAVGSGSYKQWTLLARAPGTTQLKLKRWRPWEGDASVQERFAVTLIVRP